MLAGNLKWKPINYLLHLRKPTDFNFFHFSDFSEAGWIALQAESGLFSLNI